MLSMAEDRSSLIFEVNLLRNLVDSLFECFGCLRFKVGEIEKILRL
jgi:hypothetical protein